MSHLAAHRNPAPADAATARERLSRNRAPCGRPFDLFAEVLEVLAEGGMHITLAWRMAGSPVRLSASGGAAGHAPDHITNGWSRRRP